MADLYSLLIVAALYAVTWWLTEAVARHAAGSETRK